MLMLKIDTCCQAMTCNTACSKWSEHCFCRETLPCVSCPSRQRPGDHKARARAAASSWWLKRTLAASSELQVPSQLTFGWCCIACA